LIDAERVDFIGVPVQDLKRADEFYGTTLGLERSPHSGPRWVEYETGNVTLALISPEAMGPRFPAEAALNADRAPRRGRCRSEARSRRRRVR
jgi:catechol 2,3-dioxygenase-like lactoylglutathione lyase family enzyme